jgi:hypothetical protein
MVPVAPCLRHRFADQTSLMTGQIARGAVRRCSQVANCCRSDRALPRRRRGRALLQPNQELHARPSGTSVPRTPRMGLRQRALPRPGQERRPSLHPLANLEARRGPTVRPIVERRQRLTKPTTLKKAAEVVTAAINTDSPHPCSYLISASVAHRAMVPTAKDDELLQRSSLRVLDVRLCR